MSLLPVLGSVALPSLRRCSLAIHPGPIYSLACCRSSASLLGPLMDDLLLLKTYLQRVFGRQYCVARFQSLPLHDFNKKVTITSIQDCGDGGKCSRSNLKAKRAPTRQGPRRHKNKKATFRGELERISTLHIQVRPISQSCSGLTHCHQSISTLPYESAMPQCRESCRSSENLDLATRRDVDVESCYHLGPSTSQVVIFTSSWT